MRRLTRSIGELERFVRGLDLARERIVAQPPARLSRRDERLHIADCSQEGPRAQLYQLPQEHFDGPKRAQAQQVVVASDLHTPPIEFDRLGLKQQKSKGERAREHTRLGAIETRELAGARARGRPRTPPSSRRPSVCGGSQALARAHRQRSFPHRQHWTSKLRLNVKGCVSEGMDGWSGLSAGSRSSASRRRHR